MPKANTTQAKLGTGAAIDKKETTAPVVTGAAAGGELSSVTKAALARVSALSDSDFYTAGGKTVPGARALQHLANEAGGITTEIMEHVLDEERSSVRVRGWRPSNPGLFKEDVCTIIFKTAWQLEMWRLVESGCPAHKGRGCPVRTNDGVAVLDKSGTAPIFVEDKCNLHALQNFLRIKNFADRTCVTKAEGRVHAKLLNVEWRDEDEIEEERREIEVVAGPGGKAEQATPKAEKKAEPAKAAEPAKSAATTQAQPAAQTAAAPKPATAAPAAAQPVQATQPAAAQTTAGPTKAQRVAKLAKDASVTDKEMLDYICRAVGVAEPKDAPRGAIEAAIKTLESFRDTSGSAALSDLVLGKASPDVMNAVSQAYEKERAA